METVEILASAGYDFIILDMEHAPLGTEMAYRMIVTAERSGMASLIRLRGHDMATANTLLDAGASGILVPHCSPYDKAKELIEEMMFPPAGRRGAGAGGRATQWGMGGGIDAYYARGNDDIVRVPMIEDPEAIEDIERIISLPGVDAVFIGRGDLTQTLGDRDEAERLADRALQVCVEHGIPAATTAYGDDYQERVDQGFRWLAIGADTGTFTQAVQRRLQVVRGE
jgi:2-keto-3-deoxy-L-rhamnonate aldolase RhmA